MSNEFENNSRKGNTSAPIWAQRLIQVIDGCWRHHARCDQFKSEVTFNNDLKTWLVEFSPVLETFFGGDGDGSLVWCPFHFEAGKFSRIVGVDLRDLAVKSRCNHCSPAEAHLSLKGKYRGHRVLIRIFLEPRDPSRAPETIDGIVDPPF